MKPRISMITLGVSDLVAATRFYEVGLGLPRLPFEGDAVFFRLSGTWLGAGIRATSRTPMGTSGRSLGIRTSGWGRKTSSDEIRAAPQEQEKALAVRPHQA